MASATNISEVPPTSFVFTTTSLPVHWSLADVQNHLGGIPLHRIRSFPPPGMATEDDMLALNWREGVLCELIDGVLVEKPLGTFESMLAIVLATELQIFLKSTPLGILIGADGPLRLRGGNVRYPDLSFIKWERLPNKRAPRRAVWRIPPDLAVEVLSPSNTVREIELKIKEYFESGSQSVWIIDPIARSAQLYESPTQFVSVSADGYLEAPTVLPGFKTPLGELLDRVPLADEAVTEADSDV